MRKLILTSLLVLCLVGTVHAGGRKVQSVLSSTKGTTISVPLTTTAVYSLAIPIQSAKTSENIGVMYKPSPATADVAIYFYQSYKKPDTEGTFETNYVLTDVITTSADGKEWRMATIDTVEMPWGLFKIKGTGSNPATATIQMKISK